MICGVGPESKIGDKQSLLTNFGGGHPIILTYMVVSKQNLQKRKELNP